VGREREQGEIRDHLESARLLTLTGAGGIGKTRLALEEAQEFGERALALALARDVGPPALASISPLQSRMDGVRRARDAFGPHLASGWTEQRQQLGRATADVLVRLAHRLPSGCQDWPGCGIA
jgi:hypothetical protein